MKKATLLNKILQLFKKKEPTCQNENIANIENSHQKEEFERCAVCGQLTTVPVSLPIEFRENYEVGLGEVCEGCRQEMLKDAQGKEILTDEQVIKAVDQSRMY